MKGITRVRKIGIIGGSGLYDLEILQNSRWIDVDTNFGGEPVNILESAVEGGYVYFLSRHGKGHRFSPTGINYRANIEALKIVGVTDVISVSAVGSLSEEFHPGHFVTVDQYIDRTVNREKSFFTNGCVAHVSMAHPTCRHLNGVVHNISEKVEVKIQAGGVYLAMEGPQFSSVAESNMYRSWGANVIGMTNMPEAKLAREAEMCYASVAMVTDFDCWHPDHENVTVEQIVKTLHTNANNAKDLISKLIPELFSAPECQYGCRTSLDFALITQPDGEDPELIRKLENVAGRVLKRGN